MSIATPEHELREVPQTPENKDLRGRSRWQNQGDFGTGLFVPPWEWRQDSGRPQCYQPVPERLSAGPWKMETGVWWLVFGFRFTFWLRPWANPGRFGIALPYPDIADWE